VEGGGWRVEGGFKGAAKFLAAFHPNPERQRRDKPPASARKEHA